MPFFQDHRNCKKVVQFVYELKGSPHEAEEKLSVDYNEKHEVEGKNTVTHSVKKRLFSYRLLFSRHKVHNGAKHRQHKQYHECSITHQLSDYFHTVSPPFPDQ